MKRWRFKSPSMTISTGPKRKAWSFCSATNVAGAGSGVIGLDPYPKQVHSLDAVGQDLHFHQTRSSKRTERYFHAQGLTGLSPGFGFRQGTKKGPLPSRMRQHRRLRCDLTGKYHNKMDDSDKSWFFLWYSWR